MAAEPSATGIQTSGSQQSLNSWSTLDAGPSDAGGSSLMDEIFGLLKSVCSLNKDKLILHIDFFLYVFSN